MAVSIELGEAVGSGKVLVSENIGGNWLDLSRHHWQMVLH